MQLVAALELGTVVAVLGIVLTIAGLAGAAVVTFRSGGGSAWRDVAQARLERIDQLEDRERKHRDELGVALERIAALEERPNVDTLAKAMDGLTGAVQTHDANAEARWAETSGLFAGAIERLDRTLSRFADEVTNGK